MSAIAAVAPPTAFPPAGEYAVTQLVTLLCATPGAVIHYTTDGSAPGAGSPVFDPDRLIPTAEPDQAPGRTSVHLLRAVAVRAGAASAEAAFHYQINRRATDAYVAYPSAPGVWTIADYDDDKMYLLLGSRNALLLDAGLGNGDLRGFVEARTQGRPLEVVVTHAHPDHIARLAQFQGDYPVHMNLDDLPLVERFNQQLGYAIDPRQIRDLREGAVFDLGDRQLRVYEVPGHSPGHVVLLDEANGDLFAADAVGNNRPTIVDALWMQMPGMALIDDYLATLQGFRAKTAGRVKRIFTGHNDHPLEAEPYLAHLEAAAQKLVDQGVSALTPALRPAGAWMTSSGDRLTDPSWAAINVDRGRCLTAEPDQLAALSCLEVRGAALRERFFPARLEYSAGVGQAVTQVAIVPTTASTRAKALTINGQPAAARRPYAAALAEGRNVFEIGVVSPDGTQQRRYTLTIQRG